MEEYLNTPIKEVITRFPKVADILNEYNIGCVPCNVGSCLLKDIVQIHNLPEGEEAALMAKIAKVIYPGRDLKIPKVARKPKSSQIRYSPPIKKLVDEHTLIKKWLALIPEVIEELDIESEEGRHLILEGINFIRSYADRFHHAKEEDILFGYVDKNLDIIKTMLADHETARSHVKAILEAIKAKDKGSIIEHLNGYGKLLVEHIKKEDEILYPWIDRGLSLSQVGEIFAKFNEAEQNLDKEVIQSCKRFIEQAGQRIENLKLKKEVIK